VLNQARVSVYPIQIVPPGSAGTPPDVLGAFEGIARSTGGNVLNSFHNTSDFADSLAHLRTHVNPYYELSFSVPPQKRSWISTTIKVPRPDVKVTAPNGFIAGQ